MLIEWFQRDAMPRYAEDDGAESQAASDSQAADTSAETDTAAELDRMRKALKEANRFSEARRKRLEELEAAEATRRQAEMAEVDRVKSDLAALQAQHDKASAELRRHRILSAARKAAEALKLDFHPAALDDMLALGAFDDLETNDRGDFLEINETLRALVKARPYLLKAEATPPPSLDGAARGKHGAGDAAEQKLERNSARWGIKMPTR